MLHTVVQYRCKISRDREAQPRSKQLVVEAKKSEVFAAANSPQSNKASAARLVIRVDLTSEAPPPSVSPRIDPRVVALVIGIIAVLTAIGVSVFRNDPPVVAEVPGKSHSESAPESNAPAAASNNELPSNLAASNPKTEPTRSEPARAKSASVKPVKPEAPPSPLNEVLPDASQSALRTIRGTVRVSVRVVIDKEGKVVSAISEIPGPSRYFERISRSAAQKWTFTSADSQEQRTLLIRFGFTREGVTARSVPAST